LLRRVALLTTLMVLAGLVVAAAPTGATTTDTAEEVDVRHIDPHLQNKTTLRVRPDLGRSFQSSAALQVGDTKKWFAWDDEFGEVYLKKFRLRAKSKHGEVWVATNLSFQSGDCRNDERIKISKRKARYLSNQFADNIYPKESKAFSKPPERDGSRARHRQFGVNLPKGYFKGPGKKIVILVDNVRDDNFYDTDNSQNIPYIAGFFMAFFNEITDRNIMTVDSYDWKHRTKANPPHEPVPGDNCASKPARPFLVEETFAHEYQHLLEYYEDGDEYTWVDEGLADWAQRLTGYSKPQRTIDEVGFDRHIQCFLGHCSTQTDANPNPSQGGPENSLTIWEDQGDPEILADYGAAYSFMELLHSRHGKPAMTKLHRNNANGFAGLQNVLSALGGGDALSVLRDWAAMVALDGVLDGGAVLQGGDPGAFSAAKLTASVNWDSPDSYASPGAPPNGSDYVRLRAANGDYLTAADLDSISFDGAEAFPADPWSIDTDPEGRPGNPALFSGAGTLLDRAIVQEVNVPNNNATLTFDTRYELEDRYDFGFVQVSTDDGQTWQSLSNANTTSTVNADTIDKVKDNVPGFTGSSGGWTPETFDLSAFAGDPILLAFRYVTDGSVTSDGWWVDDVAVGNQTLSNGSTLAGWTATELDPTPIQGFHVRLIAYEADGTDAWTTTLPLAGNSGSLADAALDSALGTSAETVAAIVTFVEPTESIAEYAPYTLTVNGVAQPGGS